MTRTEQAAIAGAVLFAIGMPLATLWSGGAQPVGPRAAPAPLSLHPAGAPLTAIYSRNLFGSGSAAEQESVAPADAPALVGIVGRIGSDAVAMVRSADDTSRTLQVGESVDGWTLESLAIDAAFFTRGGQRVRVPLPAG